MKYKKESKLGKKILIYLIIFSVLILSFLWFFQVAFLNKYYEIVKTKEIEKIALKIKQNYNSDDIEDILDSLSYEEGVCIQIINNNDEVYSSNSFNRGCMGVEKGDITYFEYKQDLINNNLNKKIYKLENPRFGNKMIMYGLKLDNDNYVIVNASLQPLDSTINILASQLVYVTIIVLILSFIIAYFISRRISRPIVKLNDIALNMAKGEHDIKFNTDSDILELNSLANTLNQANSELSKTDELRRELMANVSHDLKTPLTMIKAYAEMVRDLTFNNKEKRDSNLNTIIDETDRLNLLVNDTLELSKMQSNVIELNIEVFDLANLINTVLDRFKYLESRGYIFEYSGPKKAMISADKRKMEQVIYNLVGNATNYVSNDKRIIVKITSTDDKYLVEIKDYGKGIDDNDLDLIWDKYYRVDKKHQRNTIGTGLGLSIVKNIFIMHNLEYGVKSKKNKGTTFYFKIKKEK